MSDLEVIDVQARQDIAVIKSGLEKIDRTLSQIFTAIIVAMAGGAGAALWNVVYNHSGH